MNIISRCFNNIQKFSGSILGKQFVLPTIAATAGSLAGSAFPVATTSLSLSRRVMQSFSPDEYVDAAQENKRPSKKWIVACLALAALSTYCIKALMPSDEEMDPFSTYAFATIGSICGERLAHHVMGREPPDVVRTVHSIGASEMVRLAGSYMPIPRKLTFISKPIGFAVRNAAALVAYYKPPLTSKISFNADPGFIFRQVIHLQYGNTAAFSQEMIQGLALPFLVPQIAKKALSFVIDKQVAANVAVRSFNGYIDFIRGNRPIQAAMADFHRDSSEENKAIFAATVDNEIKNHFTFIEAASLFLDEPLAANFNEARVKEMLDKIPALEEQLIGFRLTDFSQNPYTQAFLTIHLKAYLMFAARTAFASSGALSKSEICAFYRNAIGFGVDLYSPILPTFVQIAVPKIVEFGTGFIPEPPKQDMGFLYRLIAKIHYICCKIWSGATEFFTYEEKAEPIVQNKAAKPIKPKKKRASLSVMPTFSPFHLILTGGRF